jgi:8-oxo-dGTP pyrophosphatase MutT (NUDIX family)
MTMPETPTRIETVADISFRFVESETWRFEQDRTAEIAAHWQKRIASNPHLFDGRVLLMRKPEIVTTPVGPCLQGTCFKAAYKSFIAWRDFGFPDQSAVNVFGMAALRSKDGAFLLGEMGRTTASAGRIYFPAGTPDLSDLKDGYLDMEGSVLRELREETGIGRGAMQLDDGWTVVFDGAYLACMKTIRTPLPAVELVARVDQYLAGERDPELARLKPVFSPADFEHGRMPAFALAFMRHIWNGEDR